MELWNKPRTWLALGVVVAALLLVQQFWHWEIERQEVPPNHFLVRVHLWGKNLEPDEIIALDDDHKGVLLDVLSEGRHFLNPLLWDVEIHKATIVPPGKCLVQVRKFGKKIPPERLARGEFLAGPDERGVVREVLGPGKYYINPHAYDVVEQDALEIHHNEVGVRTLLWGKDPRELKLPNGSAYVVSEGYRGVQEKPVSPGTHYFNPYVEKIERSRYAQPSRRVQGHQLPVAGRFLPQPACPRVLPGAARKSPGAVRHAQQRRQAAPGGLHG